MIKALTLLAALGAAVTVSFPPAAWAQPSLVVAGTLHVDLRATNGSAGLATWTNQGALGSFTRNGTPALVNDVAGTGIPGVLLNGTTDVYVGPVSVADLEGASDRSVEVWALNPSIADEETLVAWAHRGGPEGSNLSINYGSNVGTTGYGAVGHWGGSYDLGWPSADRVPTANEWHHIVYAYDGNRTATVYVDGAVRVSKILPAALNTYAGDTINIGSQRDNATTLTAGLRLSGYINTVRIHGGLLSSNDVAANYAYGPAFVPPTGPVAFTSQPQNQAVGEGGLPTFSVSTTGERPISYQWYRNAVLLPEATNRTLTVGPVTLDDNGAQFFCLAANVSGGTAYSATSSVATLTILTIASTLTHRYNFTSNANDFVGTAHGTLQGPATLSGGQVSLNGSSAYVDLPDNLVTGYTSVTFETWVMNTGAGTWARVWDFGNAAGVNMFLTWPSGSSTLRVAYNQGSGEQLVEAPLPGNNTMHHLVWTQDGASRVARIYVNGVQVGQNTGFTLTPAAIGVTANDWLGRSQYAADPYFIGRIDEFRIYNAALPATKVLENFLAGPDAPPSDGPVAVIAQPADATVIENTTATFRVALNGRPPYAVQWFKNGTPIPGATSSTLNYLPALAEDGALIQLWATNSVQGTNYFTASSNAVLHVLVDTNPPVLVRASGAGASSFEVLFSELVSAATATNLAHYTLTGPGGLIPLVSASLNPDGVSVTVQTAPLVLSQIYTVVVNQVQDRAATPNTLAPNSTATFVATAFRLRDIGTPAVASSLVSVPGGYDVTAGGTGIGASSDQFTLGFDARTGDFDVAVRLSALSLSDIWARAGLMARNGLSTNDAFAAAWATPGPAGCFFQSRSTTSTNIEPTGAFPVNHPYTWLRLRRTGNLFDGFASIDGQGWWLLGSASIAMSSTVQVGLAVTAHSANATTTAGFRDYAAAAGSIVTGAPLPFEPMAPCTRKTGLVFSEIMYNPPDVWSTNSLEYVEIHNPDLFYEELGGYRLAGDIDYTLPPGTTLRSGTFLVIARNPAAVEAYYGISGVLGPYTNNLPNEGGTLRLINDVGGIVLEINYDDKTPWPVAADGTGHSLVLHRPSFGEDDPRAWGPSDVVGGSPGRGDAWGPEPLRRIVVNEFLANSDPPQTDFIELYNTSTQPVDLSGAWLSDDPGTNKFQIPNGTVLGLRGVVHFDEATLGFALRSDGDEILLWNPSRTRVIEALRFGGQAPNVSRGRAPDGAPLWSELEVPTPGALNASPLQREMVINEIMYHPLSGDSNDEYVELYNRGTSAVNLGGWKLSDGISFTFPSNAVVAPGGYVVVAENLTNLRSKYAQLNPANAYGNFGGNLANGGERLVLEMPLATVRTNSNGIVITNVAYITVNEVTYRDGGRWGRWSDGGGSSLEVIDPRADNRFAANWADSDESQKAPWTTVDFTGLLDNGMTQGSGTPDRFEILMQDAGECLIDDIECRSASNPTVNRVLNNGFEGGATNWTFMGTHRPSFIADGVGTGGSKALHVVAVDRGDPGPNKLWTRIATMPTGANGTIRAKMRWLKGTRFCLLRTRGQWIEAEVAMTVPPNLGTPGLPNSRLDWDTGPIIADVTHTPVLPAANQPVVVTARVLDPDAVDNVILFYRVDPAANYTELVMTAGNVSGDALLDNDVYSAVIPGQPTGAMVAFYIFAVDDPNIGPASRFPREAPARECLIHFGESEFAGGMGTYRFWLTQANIDTWTFREWNSNEPFDATFAYGNWRVIYNIGALYSASPWHTRGQPYTGPLGSTACDYELLFPSDDRFLGWQDFVLAAQESYVSFFNNDLTCQAEYTCYWLGRQLGLPYNHKRVVRGVLNGQRRGMIFFDHQQPNGEYVDEYFPDDNQGNLHKIEDWFEFDDIGNGFEIITCTLQKFVTTGGAKKAARYRYNWRPRAVTGSPNDYADLFSLVDAVAAPQPEPYTSATASLMDVEQWMRVFALQHTVGNWDTYGYERGKNAFAYKPERGPWRLLLWDMELVLGKDSRSPQDGLFNTAGSEPIIAAMYNYPPFVRAFWRAMSELVNGPLLAPQYTPRMVDRYTALMANGMPVEHPSSIWTWLDQRRTYIVSQIPSAAFTVTGTNFIQTTNASLTLTGTAPVTAEQILVNGNAYPITWTGPQTAPTGWRIHVPVAPGTTELVIAAVDSKGHVIGSKTNTVNSTAAEVSPVGLVVINEIMYNPVIPETSYLELFNRGTNVTFDLSGWRLDGLGFTFAPGTVITNRQFIVVSKNRFAHAATYGATNLVGGEFPAELDNGGETVSLIKPGATPEQDLVVDRVRYDNETPWPSGAAGQGYALQLIDNREDNSRVSNWAGDASGWRFASLTGILQTNGTNIALLMNAAGDVYIDDLSLVAGSTPAVGENLIVNGGFEDPLASPWFILGTAHASSAVSTAQAHSGTGSLHVVATAIGTVGNSIRHTITPPLSSNTYTVSFWYLSSTNGTTLTVRALAGSALTLTVNFRPPPVSSPGATNSVVGTLPPYPPLWLNEVQPENVSGLADGAGDRDPWIELYNAGPDPISLDGMFLADSYASLNQWAFPAGAVINPGQFLVVWADGEPGESTATEFHTGFRLNPTNGSVVLSRSAGILDYFNYHAVPANHTYGAVPDGQPFYRQVLFYPTPGAANNGASPPAVVFINEWMAANTSASGIADPADNDYDDWFELYNPGPGPVDLGGYFLTDTLADRFQYQVPNNGQYVIPPQGFLLVWADNETGQNRSNRADLHVNFQLRQAGEAIVLSAPDGTVIDTVTFGAQTENVSEGPYPDGVGPRVFMTTPTPRAPNVPPVTTDGPELSAVSVSPDGLSVSFSFRTVAGAQYQVQFKDDLGLPDWQPLGGTYFGNGSSIVITDLIGDHPQRFYRVVVLP